MPRSTDPDQFFKVSLDSDLSQPEDVRPTFIFKPFTVRGWRKLVAQIESMSSVDSAEAGVKAGIVGWQNLGEPGATAGDIPFSVDAVEDVLTPLEIVELFGKVCDDTTIGPADKKKSDSPPSSTAASLAAAAPAAEPPVAIMGQAAPTAPLPSDPSKSSAQAVTDSDQPTVSIATAAGTTS